MVLQPVPCLFRTSKCSGYGQLRQVFSSAWCSTPGACGKRMACSVAEKRGLVGVAARGQSSKSSHSSRCGCHTSFVDAVHGEPTQRPVLAKAGNAEVYAYVVCVVQVAVGCGLRAVAWVAPAARLPVLSASGQLSTQASQAHYPDRHSILPS